MTFFKAIKKNFLIISIVLVIVGYYLIINGVGSLDFVMSILAFGLMISGIYGVIRYFFLKNDERIKRNDFVFGLIFIVLGVILYFTKEKLRDFSILAFAIIIIVSGIMKIQDYLDARRVGVHNFAVYITLTIICVAFGALIIINPFNEEMIYKITGSGLIFAGVCDIISNIYLAAISSRYERLIKKGIDPNKPQEEKEKIPEAKFIRIDDDQEEKPLE